MRRMLATLAAALVGTVLTSTARPCSRVLWNDNGRSVLVGRNMDWFEDLKSNLWVLPRQMKRDGLAATNPLAWTSKYGSLVITGYDSVAADGINEKGLAAHMLYLPETKPGPRDEKVPGLAITMWVQYYLDNFATVKEGLEALKTRPYQLLMTVEPTSGMAGTIHIALDDPTGDSAVLECIDGEIKVYHSRDYTVMTNQPTFDRQLENLKQYRGFGGDKRLPGTHEAADRFVRAAYYVKNLPRPKTDREAVAAMLSVMRNVSAPFGVADPERPNIATTIWRTVTDLTHGVLYYDGVFSPQVFWVDTNKLKFDAGEPVRKLTVVDHFDLMGEVSGKFEKAEMFQFLRPN
ncbi:MAG: linear amide C-N hydrolase [Isosphaeraceae bacterium]